MSCWFGFLYSVSFHDLPFFIQSQKPGSTRFLLSVQHRWVNYIIVFKNRFFKLAFRRKKFLSREEEERTVRENNGSFSELFLLPSRNLSTRLKESALGQVISRTWSCMDVCPCTFFNIQRTEKDLLLLGEHALARVRVSFHRKLGDVRKKNRLVETILFNQSITRKSTLKQHHILYMISSF